MDFHYLRDPIEIEAESFRRIRQLTDLHSFEESAQQVVMRLVHTSGIPGIATNLCVSADAIAAGVGALTSGAPILCDVEMLRHGLTKQFIDSPCLCFIGEADVAELARERGETRSMTALDHWIPRLGGAIAAIGNAPTALYRLLELLQGGAAKPSLIIGMPVGFVGAAESKDALLEYAEREGIPSILLRGRLGGSAMAAAVVNTLARLSKGVTV